MHTYIFFFFLRGLPAGSTSAATAAGTQPAALTKPAGFRPAGLLPAGLLPAGSTFADVYRAAGSRPAALAEPAGFLPAGSTSADVLGDAGSQPAARFRLCQSANGSIYVYIYIYIIYIYLYLLQVDFLLKSSTKPFGPELRPERGQLVHARLPALEPRLRGKRSNASFPFMTLLKIYINKHDYWQK